MANTPHRGLPYPELDELADVPVWLHDLALALDADTSFSMGPLAGRPVSTPVSPGESGRWFYATDRPDVIDFDTGTAWVTIGNPPDDIALGYMPSVGVYRNAALNLTAAFAAIPFDAESWERNVAADTMHSTAVNPTRLICPTDGVYLMTLSVAQEIVAAAARPTYAVLRRNGVTIDRAENHDPVANAPYALTMSTVRACVAGDYWEAWVASGGVFALEVGTTAAPNSGGTHAELTMLSR